jgi:hypothetical protein
MARIINGANRSGSPLPHRGTLITARSEGIFNAITRKKRYGRSSEKTATTALTIAAL